MARDTLQRCFVWGHKGFIAVVSPWKTLGRNGEVKPGRNENLGEEWRDLAALSIQKWVCPPRFPNQGSTKLVSAGLAGCPACPAWAEQVSWFCPGLCWWVCCLKSRLEYGGDWSFLSDSQTMPWHPAALWRSARFPTKQGVFMKLLSSWKTKWEKKKKEMITQLCWHSCCHHRLISQYIV